MTKQASIPGAKLWLRQAKVYLRAPERQTKEIHGIHTSDLFGSNSNCSISPSADPNYKPAQQPLPQRARCFSGTSTLVLDTQVVLPLSPTTLCAGPHAPGRQGRPWASPMLSCFPAHPSLTQDGQQYLRLRMDRVRGSSETDTDILRNPCRAEPLS